MRAGQVFSSFHVQEYFVLKCCRPLERCSLGSLFRHSCPVPEGSCEGISALVTHTRCRAGRDGAEHVFFRERKRLGLRDSSPIAMVALIA